ncbi:uncharacterized protein LOC108676698 isoform X2 [Hyalella azteca]|nr:uncharacterized protein LOC108676698 isoform X2 [Hyalella azteca]
MADPSDTAALCTDTRGTFDQGQPADLDVEAGAVVREEPMSMGDDLNTEKTADGELQEEGEEGVAGDEEAEPIKTEFKVPFVYLIVEPGCTPLSCYSAILTFIVMSCGVFWLLLISPPLNAKPYETRMPWLDNRKTNVSEAPNSTSPELLISGFQSNKIDTANLLDVEPQATLLNTGETLETDSPLSGDGSINADIVSEFLSHPEPEEFNQT